MGVKFLLTTVGCTFGWRIAIAQNQEDQKREVCCCKSRNESEFEKQCYLETLSIKVLKKDITVT
jgi:hypothetical protein